MHEKDLHIAGCYESKPNALGKTRRLQIVDKSSEGICARDRHGKQTTADAESFSAWAQRRVISLHPLCDLDDTPVPPLKQEAVQAGGKP